MKLHLGDLCAQVESRRLRQSSLRVSAFSGLITGVLQFSVNARYVFVFLSFFFLIDVVSLLLAAKWSVLMLVA